MEWWYILLYFAVLFAITAGLWWVMYDHAKRTGRADYFLGRQVDNVEADNTDEG